MAIFNTVYGGTGSRLPSEYQEVEYIQTSWTQYINLWFQPTSNHQTEVKIELVNTNQDQTIFWTLSNSDWSHRWYSLTPYSNKWYSWLNNTETSWWTYTATVWLQYTIVFNNSSSYLNINGSNVYSVSWTTWMSWSKLCVAYRWTGNVKYWVYKYFYFKVYDKSTSQYVKDLVPCYRKADTVIWMYDLVSDTFYTNSWSWTFTKWPDIN